MLTIINKPVDIDKFYLIYAFYRTLQCYGEREFWLTFPGTWHSKQILWVLRAWKDTVRPHMEQGECRSIVRPSFNLINALYSLWILSLSTFPNTSLHTNNLICFHFTYLNNFPFIPPDFKNNYSYQHIGNGNITFHRCFSPIYKVFKAYRNLFNLYNLKVS